MKRFLWLLFAIALVFGLVGTASALNIGVVNNSFETGDFSGWTTASFLGGSWDVVTSSTSSSNEYSGNYITYSATDGGYFAQLTASALVSQYVTWNAGDVLTFDWAFQAWDFPSYNDYAYFKTGGVTYTLSSVSAVGIYGETNWDTYTHVFTSAGSGDIEFGVVNIRDDNNDSRLLVDNVGGAPVPEPAAILLLGTGLLGLAGARRKMRK